jgi:MscS family membrane protein
VAYLPLSGALALVADRLIRSLIVIVIFWILVCLIEPFSALLHRLEKVLTVPMVEWLKKAIKVALVFIGLATVFEIWGIRIAPIIAGLGLFGVAVALGAQDLFKNLISGMLILAERRFNIGNWIYVDGVVEGTVESIGFRSTLVRRFDKAPVFVPNSKLSDSSVTNFSAMTHRRIYWTIGVEYRTTIDQLRQIRDGIEAYLLGSEDFAHPPQVPTFVRIDRFNDSSIDIMVYCFTRTTEWGRWLEIKERLAYRIKELVESAGTAFAFPSQSVYVESLPPSERAEMFIPPANPVAEG